jgi:CO dehydrogenase maturation factor
MVIRYIIDRKRKPVLAVDADANSCLNEALGLDIHATIGSLREESLNTIRSGSEMPGGMSMEQLFDYQIQQSIIESKGFDLIVMGRPEGAGCYCAANNIIRKYTDKLSETYPYVVIDNEAGMEHLSRRTTHKVEVLLIISDSSIRGIQTAKRINDLVDELKLEIGKRVFIINRVWGNKVEELKNLAGQIGVNVVGLIPHDENVLRLDLKGKSIFHLPDESKAIKAVYSMLDSVGIS